MNQGQSITLSFIFIILAISNLQAQKFGEGYLVTAPGDTLKGLVSTDRLSRKQVLFKNNSDGEVKTISPDKFISLFVKSDNDYYFSAIVKVDIKPIKSSDLENDPNPKYVLDTVILRALSRGKANLFTFSDRNKEHFFLQLDQGEIEELLNIKYFSPAKSAQVNAEFFKQQLTNALTGCSLKFTNIYFSESTLKKVVDKYNRCQGVVSNLGLDEKRTKPNFYVLGGASINLSNSYIGQDLTGNFQHNVVIHPSQMKYENKTNFTFGLGYLLESKRTSVPFSFGAELFWRQFSTQGFSDFTNGTFTTVNTHVSFDFSAVQMNVLVQWKFHGKISPYIQGGVSVNGYVKKESNYSYTATNPGVVISESGPVCKFDTFSFGLFFGTGINYKRFILTTRFETLPANSSVGTDSQFQAINLNVLAGYKIIK